MTGEVRETGEDPVSGAKAPEGNVGRAYSTTGRFRVENRASTKNKPERARRAGSAVSGYALPVPGVPGSLMDQEKMPQRKMPHCTLSWGREEWQHADSARPRGGSSAAPEAGGGDAEVRRHLHPRQRETGETGAASSPHPAPSPRAAPSLGCFWEFKPEKPFWETSHPQVLSSPTHFLLHKSHVLELPHPRSKHRKVSVAQEGPRTGTGCGRMHKLRVASANVRKSTHSAGFWLYLKLPVRPQKTARKRRPRTTPERAQTCGSHFLPPYPGLRLVLQLIFRPLPLPAPRLSPPSGQLSSSAAWLSSWRRRGCAGGKGAPASSEAGLLGHSPRSGKGPEAGGLWPRQGQATVDHPWLPWSAWSCSRQAARGQLWAVPPPWSGRDPNAALPRAAKRRAVHPRRTCWREPREAVGGDPLCRQPSVTASLSSLCGAGLGQGGWTGRRNEAEGAHTAVTGGSTVPCPPPSGCSLPPPCCPHTGGQRPLYLARDL